MNFKIYQHRLSQLSDRFNLMVALVFGLLVTNVIMGGLAFYGFVHQKIEVTPFFGEPHYFKSDSVIDEQYLKLMSENFVYLRLNATPETIFDNHKRLLGFVDSQEYTSFKKQLEKEAGLIVTQKISSHFELQSIVSNPSNMQCQIKGILKRSVGIRELQDAPLVYTLEYKYRFGRLAITKFIHEENSHA